MDDFMKDNKIINGIPAYNEAILTRQYNLKHHLLKSIRYYLDRNFVNHNT